MKDSGQIKHRIQMLKHKNEKYQKMIDRRKKGPNFHDETTRIIQFEDKITVNEMVIEELEWVLDIRKGHTF